MRIWPGDPYPLGAAYDGAGTNFSLFPEVAEGVELCRFDPSGEETRIALTEVQVDGSEALFAYRLADPQMGETEARSIQVLRRV